MKNLHKPSIYSKFATLIATHQSLIQYRLVNVWDEVDVLFFQNLIEVWHVKSCNKELKI